ncbi:MAG TPA: HDIG domain-containing protein [Bryobacteraceae bacterium]|nr:HDIG domain-containing protein [Bryobacteraceae bacterium]
MRWRGSVVLLAVPLVVQPADMRARAWDALRSHVRDEHVLNHSLAVEAIMHEFATPKTDDADEWAVAGLLHDIDVAATGNDLSRHGLVAAPLLRALGFSEAVVHAVSAHDDHAGVPRRSRMDHGLYCADQVYWLIKDSGVSLPAAADAVWRKAQSMPWKADTVKKTSGECAEIGLTMPRAFEAALAGMRKASR